MRFDRRQQRLVLAAQTGDREALDLLLREIDQDLYRYLASLVQDRHLAEDLLQETLMLVYRKLYWLREPVAFPAWAYRIASRGAMRALKKRGRDETTFDTELCESTSTADDSHFDHERSDLIRRLPEVLESVSPASRAVLSLHYLCELSLAEVADVLSISTGTVKSRLAYGLSQLRARLNPSI